MYYINYLKYRPITAVFAAQSSYVNIRIAYFLRADPISAVFGAQSSSCLDGSFTPFLRTDPLTAVFEAQFACYTTTFTLSCSSV